ncbi:MAG: hypothetical protein AB7P03_19515 [Kofleriaceae bacterium]
MSYGQRWGVSIVAVILTAASAASAQPAEYAPQPQPPGYPAAQPAPQPPPGSSHATFVSTTAEGWEVVVDREPACETPCSLWIAPLQFVSLRTQERRPIRLDVGYLPAGNLMVAAKPLSKGMYATGITFTALSGMAVVTGITLTAVGCSGDRDTVCKAGVISMVSGGVALAGSIWLMRQALPYADVGPAQPYVTGQSVGVAGTF